MPSPRIGAAHRPLRLLVVVQELPRPDQIGGDHRLCALLRMLTVRHRVYLYPYISSGDAHAEARYRSALLRDGVRVRRGAWVMGLEDMLVRHTFDAVLFEYWWAAERGMDLVRRHQPWARILVDTVDVHFRREEAEAALGLGNLNAVADRKRRELATYRAADGVICVTEEDGEWLETEMGPLRRFTISNVVAERPRSVRARDRELLFVGGFWHIPNRDGVSWFLGAIWPAIRAAIPDARFSVVGSSLPDELRDQFRAAGADVIGYVPDLAPYLDRAALMVAPLRYGAGIKTKVTEAMASSLAVVTTTVGAQGLDVVSGEHLLIADEPDAFARAVVDLLRDPARAERIGRAGRDYIASVCFPDAIEPRLGAMLGEVVTEGRPYFPPWKWWASRMSRATGRARSSLARIPRRGYKQLANILGNS